MDHNFEHKSHRISWLRAAVLGANDGIVSTASLIIGVAAAAASNESIMLAGIAALVAGAMSMAAGEYVSVSSQSDTEKADIELERLHLEENPEYELEELAGIYQQRGLDEDLAKQVAEKLMRHDALGAHARDELGILDTSRAQPLLAAVSSGISFSLGAALPLLVAYFSPHSRLVLVVAISSLLSLALLGVLAASAGGAPKLIGALRVTFWGALAMAVTAGVGSIIGTAI